ncbi:MAG: hypothetical protein ABSC19_14100 [Syntrophorhabdales bacterium]|jgi:hypothetical protein
MLVVAAVPGKHLLKEGRDLWGGEVIIQAFVESPTCPGDTEFMEQYLEEEGVGCSPGRGKAIESRGIEFFTKPGQIAGDHPAVAAFLEKMKTQKAKEIYKTRGPIAEFANAWIKSKIGLRAFRLRPGTSQSGRGSALGMSDLQRVAMDKALLEA